MFSPISRFMEVAQVKWRCQRYQSDVVNSIRPFSFFVIKNFPRYQFLDVVQVKGRCQRYQSDVLNSMRPFSFFVIKNFSSISISGCCTGKREVSTVPTRYPEQYATIFVFRFKTFFFHISFFGGHTDERKVSTVPTRCIEQYTAFFVFRSKKFSSISRFLVSHR